LISNQIKPTKTPQKQGGLKTAQHQAQQSMQN